MELFIFCVVLLSFPHDSKESGDWCYEPQVNCTDSHSCKGPMEWNEVASACAGSKQSPVNIVTAKAKYNSSLKPFDFVYYNQSNTVTIKNNGHSAQITLNSSIKVSGGGLPTTYKAVQMHFHWGTSDVKEIGSEHTIDGERYPMELHIVHIKENFADLNEAIKEADGIAVLGFLYNESGSPNANYDSLITSLSNIALEGNSTTINNFMLEKLIPSKENMAKYYRYSGSLTTPACNEAVVWTVFAEPIQLSKDQLQAFPNNLLYTNGKNMTENYRPLQRLNGRTIQTSSSCIVASSSLLAANGFFCSFLASVIIYTQFY